MDRFAGGRWPSGIHHVGAAHARRERETAGERFAETDNIRCYAAVLAGKPFPGAPETGVNLVENEQRAVVITELAEQWQEFQRRNVDAAARLDGLDEDGADLLPAEGLANARFHFVAADVKRLCQLRFADCGLWIRRLEPPHVGGCWKGNEMTKLAELRAERSPEVLSVRRVQGPVAQSVIRALEGDDALSAGGEHGGLERRLDRLEAGVAENGLARFRIMPRPPLKRDPAQFPRQLRLERVRMHIAHRVQERRHLPLAGADDARVRVPRRRDAERGRQVKILAALGVPDVNALRTLPDDGPVARRIEERDVARFVGAKVFEGLACGHGVFTPRVAPGAR